MTGRTSAGAWLALVAILIALACSFGADRAVAAATRAAAAEATAASLAEASAIRLAGQPTDEVWRTAPPVTEFLQREPVEGARASFPTEARVAFDASHLYVAVRAFDPEPGRIVGLLTRRDERSPSDWVRVVIDSYNDHRTAYEFAVNPVGVKQDTYWFNDQNDDPSWDAVWDVEVRTDDKGWSAEFRIPFSQLRFSPGAARFGFAVVRNIGRLNETATWPLLPRSANGYVSSFGQLTGLAMPDSPKRLELVPYAVSQVTTQPTEGNPLIHATDPGASPGVDLKFGLTPGLTLTATVNPDFGQVEADPAVVNLSAFETFFAEKRPFFIEGSGIFRFDVDCNDGACTGLFYSRRVGRTPQGDPDVPGEAHVAAPAQTTILGAAKLTGRAGAFSIGALNAVTQEERAVIASGPSRSHETVEPLTSYTVVRARREFANQSSLGFMTTFTNRRLDAAVRFLPGQAYTGGLDWDWRLSSRYALQGYWAGSTVRGDAEAIDELQTNTRHSFQRPDAEHLDHDPTRTSLDGHSGLLAISKIGGERVRFNSNAAFKSPGFDINDAGFFRRADQVTESNWIQIRWDKPSKRLRSFRINFNQWAGWNYGGDPLYGGGNINAHWNFQSNWRTGAGVNFNRGAFDDRLTRGGPGGFGNRNVSFWSYVEGDDRKPVFLNAFGFYVNDRHGTQVYEVDPRLTVRPSPAVSVSLGLRYARNKDDAQWIEKVTDVTDHYVFGRLEQTTVAFTSRVNYTITPNLSIQLYAQPFVSAGDYTSFKELVDGRAPRYADRYRAFAYADNPDFNVRSFRTTNVLRWEYKPGSTLFVVWQQGREAEDEGARGTFRFGRDFGDVFSAPARNVFLVKLAYWLNY